MGGFNFMKCGFKSMTNNLWAFQGPRECTALAAGKPANVLWLTAVMHAVLPA